MGKFPSLEAAAGACREVYSVQSPSTQFLRGEIREPQGPTKGQERKNMGLVCSSQNYFEHWWGEER